MHSSVTVSAPGKIHLMGEHAIVYGKPALLSAINLRLSATIYSSSPTLRRTRSSLPISSGSNNTKQYKNVEINSIESPELVQQSVAIIKKALNILDSQPIHITIGSDIPVGYHLGSSAAVAVALTGALLKFYTNRFDKKEINDIAYRVEKLFHGNPSGGDNTTVTYGGLLWYRKESEFLKLFSPVELPSTGVSTTLQNFFLIDTGRPKESTKEMVERVKSFIVHRSSFMQTILNKNEQATKKVLEALYINHESMLIDALREGEQTLEAMQVVSKKVMPLIRDIEKMGGAAKILGGGGKKEGVGYLLCYYRHTPYDKGKTLLTDLVQKYSYTLRDIRLGEEGVRVEPSSANYE